MSHKLRCPHCGNDYVEVLEPSLLDRLISMAWRGLKRIRCFSCLWVGRVYYKRPYYGVR